jgi:hypothetical protein
VWNAATEGLDVTGKVSIRSRACSIRFARVTVPPAHAVERLGWEPAIHPVKFTGKMFMPMGAHVAGPYSFAGCDDIVLSFAPKTGLVTAKVRMYLAATSSSDIDGTAAKIGATYSQQ